MIGNAFRHSAARALASVADRVLRVFPDRPAPTSNELASLDFEAVWTRLIEAAKTLQVSSLELALYRNEHRTMEYSWLAPEAEADAKPSLDSWSVGMSFPKSGGRRCELHATVSALTAANSVAMLALTNVLREFGTRLAAEAEPRVGLSVLRADDAQAESTSAREARAA